MVAGTKVDSNGGYPDIMIQNASFSTSTATFYLNYLNTMGGTIKASYITLGI